MKERGAFPVATVGEDLSVDRELLESPSNEPTLLGGTEGPIPIGTERSLDGLLKAWDRDTWGGDA